MKNPWGQREQPALRLMVVALAVLLGAFLIYRQVDRLRGDTLTVWVPAVDLQPGWRPDPGQVTSLQVRRRSLAKDVIPNPTTISNLELIRPKPAGQMFVEGDFRRLAADPGPGLLASVPEGRVLMTYTLPELPIQSLGTMLRLGDRFDLMAGRNRDEPLHLAHDVVFLGYIAPPEEEDDAEEESSVGGTLAGSFAAAAEQAIASPPPARAVPTPLILGVRPEDVRRLVWARSSNLRMYVIFHGRKETQAGQLLPLPAEPRPRAEELELILGASRQRIALENPP